MDKMEEVSMAATKEHALEMELKVIQNYLLFFNLYPPPHPFYLSH